MERFIRNKHLTGNLVRLQLFLAEPAHPDLKVPAFFYFLQPDLGYNNLAGDRMLLVKYHYILYVVHLEQDTFHLCRKNLETADIDDFAVASENPDPFTVLLQL